MMNTKNRVSDVNKVFLYTVLVYIGASLLLARIGRTVVIPTLLSALLSQLLLVLPSVIYVVRNKISIAQAIRLKKMQVVPVILTVIFAIFVRPLMNLVNTISLLFSENIIQNTVSDIVVNENFIVCIIAVAVIPAIFEECVYRGLFYNEYRKLSVRKGIVLSGFLFGIFHMNLNQFSYAFVLGMVFALVIEATDSILATMIIHFITNSYSLLLLKFLPSILEMTGQTTDYAATAQSSVLSREEILSTLPSMVASTIIPTVLAVFVFYQLAKTSGQWEHIRKIFSFHNDTELNHQNKLATSYLVFGMTICIVFIILNL